MKKCIACNRPLTSLSSQLSGIGPICAKKKGHSISVHSKINLLNQVNMFARRCRYDARREGNILILTDLNGPMTLTNDMDNAICELFLEHSDIKDCIVIYSDSEGMFDRVIVREVSAKSCDIDFFPIQPGKIFTDEREAIEAAKKL